MAMVSEELKEPNQDVIPGSAGYNIIEPQEVFVGDDNTVVTEEDLNITPFMVIKTLAEKLGHEICDPKPNCKKCNGRGYTGRHADTKAPVPCKCIQPNFDSVENVDMYNRTRKLSRRERRLMDKDMKKDMKKR